MSQVLHAGVFRPPTYRAPHSRIHMFTTIIIHIVCNKHHWWLLRTYSWIINAKISINNSNSQILNRYKVYCRLSSSLSVCAYKSQFMLSLVTNTAVSGFDLNSAWTGKVSLSVWLALDYSSGSSVFSSAFIHSSFWYQFFLAPHT